MDFSCVTFIFICLNAHFGGSLSYQNYKLESYKLCASKPFKKVYDFVHPPEILLGIGGEGAVLINQTWNSTNLSKLRSTCSFSIKSKSDTKFFIVITKLKLRRIKDHCIDYIQFKDGGTISDKICDDSLPIFGRRMDSFRVEVNVEKSIPIEGNLELEMLITAGRRCTDSPDQFQCNEEDEYSCIAKKFVNDGMVNCFPPCKDEGTCSIGGGISAQVADASSIALSAITSLVFTMVAVGTCVFLCWKYKDCLRPTGGTNQTTEATIELPTAPMDSNASSTEPQPRPPSPKDLPPSYESLFPERTPTPNPQPTPAS